MPFPGQVNVVPGVGVAGDFASTNPRASVVGVPGGFVAGVNGVSVGAFAWADPTNKFLSNNGIGAPTGFIGRAQNALITPFLAEASQIIPQGLTNVTVYSAGEFWVLNSGTTTSAINNKAYASNSTGLVSFAATGNPPAGATSTASSIALNNTSAGTLVLLAATGYVVPYTGAGGGGLLNATVTGGSIGPGMVLSGTGLDPATTVVKQLTGTTGSTGTYQVNVSQTAGSSGTPITLTAPNWSTLTIATTITGAFLPGQTLTGTNVATGSTIYQQITGATPSTNGATFSVFSAVAQTAAASTSITASGGTLTVGGTLTGTYAVGDLLTGSGVNAGTSITALGTGTGGAGTYYLNQGQTLASQAINANSATETKWYALSVGAPGEMVKMSSWPLG
jgi:hypothetical protein